MAACEWGPESHSYSRYVQIYLNVSSLETTFEISHEYAVFHIQSSAVLIE